MGWTDLFKSKKGPNLKPDPRIRWFGKLPTYADYYTSATDEEWAGEFNDWMLKGYELFHSRALSRANVGDDGQGRKSERLPLAGCVLRLPKSGMTALASIQDYGGDMRGRHFPLSFYVGYPSGMWPAPTSDTVGPAIRVVESLMALREDVMSHFRSPGRFETRFGDREVDYADFERESDTAWRTKARTLDLNEWFNHVRPVLKIDDPSIWYDTITRWGRGISDHDAESFEPTFRFPLALNLSIDVQIAGWIRWLERRMDLSSRLLSLILTSSTTETVGYFTVIARPLVPDDFLLVTSLAASLSYVDDLASLLGPGEGVGQETPLPRQWEAFVDS